MTYLLYQVLRRLPPPLLLGLLALLLTVAANA